MRSSEARGGRSGQARRGLDHPHGVRLGGAARGGRHGGLRANGAGAVTTFSPSIQMTLMALQHFPPL